MTGQRLDALADVLADRLRDRLVEELAGAVRAEMAAAAVPPEYIDARQVAQRLGIERRLVYELADQLGGVRIGAGARPRWRFDPQAVDEALERGIGR